MFKKTVLLLPILILFFALPAAGANRPAVSAQTTTKSKSANYRAVAFKGELLSTEIAKTTGIALNPLLCMSVLGAYSYYSTDVDQRNALPWHASPKFWGPLALVMLSILLKDSSKVALPKALTIPLDAVETLLEKKTTALLALPMLFSAINSGQYEQMKQVSAQLGNFFMPAALAGGIANTAVQTGGDMVTTLMTFVFVATIFVVVWVLSHALNILILLSPFSTLDMMLATTRNVLVSAVIGFSQSSFGFALSLAIIAVSVYFFPRALRLVIFGTVISWDIIVYRLLKKKPEGLSAEQGIAGFTSCYVGDIPPRSHGILQQVDGEIILTCRPGVLKPRRTIPTGISTGDCVLEAGILSPVILLKENADHETLRFFRIRPKYYQVYEQVAGSLQIRIAEEVSFTGKISALLDWCTSLFKKSPRYEGV